MAKAKLGRGLGSLLDDSVAIPADDDSVTSIKITLIDPNKSQPRRSFDKEKLAALSESIKEHGVIQPIILVKKGDRYKIVAGERRWRAARMLGLSEIPVTIRELSDIEAMQIAIIENLQREELNPVEEACGYAELIDKYGMTQEKVAQMVGRSRSTVANSVRMLALPKRVLKMVEEGTLSAGHAKALLGFDDEEMLIAVANRASEGELTVRQIERLAQKAADAKNSRKESKPKKEDTIYKEVEISLQQALGRRIEVHHGRKKGTLVIEFYDMDDLKALADGIYNMNN